MDGKPNLNTNTISMNNLIHLVLICIFGVFAIAAQSPTEKYFEITKNLDFLQFGIVKIISMIFAVNESLKRLPVAFKLLQLMKKINI
jgi:hypothetical protein